MTRSHEVRRRVAVSTTIVAGLLAVAPAMALAHVERTAYWPDPAPDTSVNPPAGGEVPKARDLFSARSKKRGTTRIVCQADSRARANNAITAARTKGVQDRPTEAPRKFSLKQGRRWRKFEKKLFRDCKYHDVQPAINDSGNYDRVVIMPGVYTEPASRKVPSLPPECEQYREDSDHGSGAVSYAYQFHCPNAQNLIAVLGREPGTGQDPPSSVNGRPDPHGIPNSGPCVRCNLQIEGSGPAPTTWSSTPAGSPRATALRWARSRTSASRSIAPTGPCSRT